MQTAEIRELTEAELAGIDPKFGVYAVVYDDGRVGQHGSFPVRMVEGIVACSYIGTGDDSPIYADTGEG